MIYHIPRSRNQKPVPIEVSTLKDQGWSEKDLENYLSEHLPSLVGPDLMVIGHSSPWQPEVNLLALVAPADNLRSVVSLRSAHPGANARV